MMSSVPLAVGLVLFGALVDIVKSQGNCFLASGVCPNINVTFWLRDRDSETGTQINFDNLDNVPLDESGQLVVLIHGYTGHKLYSPNMELVPAYLDRGGYNVISVDWGKMAEEGCYIHASFNVALAGRCIASFLKEFYSRRGMEWKEKTHIVGFSLGAHVSGIVGYYLPGLPRITGLDPALPFFSSFTSSLPLRLDFSDARFVDVYHTNAGKKGRVSPLGHVDFYINNGASQPGCKGNSSCDHVRAVEVFAESITSPNGFFGVPCTVGFLSFVSGVSEDVCISDQNSTGIEISAGEFVENSINGTYKIETNTIPPFAKGTRFTPPYVSENKYDSNF